MSSVLSGAGVPSFVLGSGGGSYDVGRGYTQVVPRPAEPRLSGASVASLFANRRHPVEQLHQQGDVVAVGRGQRPGERQAAAVYEEVVLAARAAAVDRAGTGLRACRVRKSIR